MKLTVGVVDYGIGNHASVRQCLHKLDLRCRVSDDQAILSACDILLLPGVGAFNKAMHALRDKSLDTFIINMAREQKPIVGICLGLQLLTEASHEHGYTSGLSLIPGETVSLGPSQWHIGWNTVHVVRKDPLFDSVGEHSYYFNHSYAYRGPDDFKVANTRLTDEFASIIRHERVVGIQFHPEKSQQAGHLLLRRVITNLCDA